MQRNRTYFAELSKYRCCIIARTNENNLIVPDFDGLYRIWTECCVIQPKSKETERIWTELSCFERIEKIITTIRQDLQGIDTSWLLFYLKQMKQQPNWTERSLSYAYVLALAYM